LQSLATTRITSFEEALLGFCLCLWILLRTLRVDNVTINERSGSLRIRQGKGLKAREVPLNAAARRAVRAYLDTRSIA
jgi:site-specific recombinase XerC